MTFPAATNAEANSHTATQAVYRKVSLRLIPLLFLCYVAAYLDRVNVGFAKLQMQEALHFSDTVYGFGAGIFFIGYFLFEIPSNLLLHKVGASRWIARIMLTWSLLSAATMWVRSPTGFYLIRFLLGMAEAGFFPGIILYLTYWFPASRRGRATSLFCTAIAFAGIVGGPASGWILHRLDQVGGLQGWQWLFALEAIPSLVLGLLVWKYLDDRVQDALWLTHAERTLVNAAIATENAEKSEAGVTSVFKNPRVWLLALVYFSIVSGLYGVTFWLPTLIQSAGVTDSLNVGLISAIPWACAMIAMGLVAASADHHLERRWHTALSGIAAAAGLVISVAAHGHAILALAGLTLAAMGIMSSLPVFWGNPTTFLRGAAAAAGIALINSVGNLAGFLAPWVIGLMKDATHSTDAGLHLMALLLVLGAALMLSLKPPAPKRA